MPARCSKNSIEAVGDYDTGAEYRAEVTAHQQWWNAEVDRLYTATNGALPTQSFADRRRGQGQRPDRRCGHVRRQPAR